MNPVESLLARRRKFLKSLKPVRYGGTPDTVPLSEIQRSMWLVQEQQPESRHLVNRFLFNIQGSLCHERLAQAWRRLIGEESILRLRLVITDEGEWGTFLPPENFTMVFEDYSERPNAHQKALLKVAEVEQTPFDLREGPLVRAYLWRTAPDSYLFLITLHHILGDATSYRLLLEKLGRLYNTSCRDDADSGNASWNYTDYVATQEAHISSGIYIDALAYWKKQLKGAEIPTLPCDFDYVESSGQSIAKTTTLLAGDELDSIRSLAETSASTPFSVMLSAFFGLLYRYTGISDLSVGVPASNRTIPEFKRIIGPLINTVPVRVNVEGCRPFSTMLENVRDAVIKNLAYQGLPFETVLRNLKAHRDVRGNAIFNCLFNFHTGADYSLQLGECACSLSPSKSEIGRYALVVNVFQDPEGFNVSFFYDDELFEHSSILRLQARYKKLLKAICDDPCQILEEIPLLLEGEWETLLKWSNGERRPYPRDSGIDDVFYQTACAHADKTAVIEGDVEVTYGDLLARSNRVAAALLEKDVGPGSVVGLLMDRSIEFCVAVLAVLKTGAAYLPVEPGQPSGRLRAMLEDSDTRLIISNEKETPEGFPVFRLQDLEEDRDGKHQEVSGSSHGEACAAVFYTSGSTGKPKGIAIPHRGILRMVCNPAHNPVSANARILFSSAVSFDAASWELWICLLNGATLVVLPANGHDPLVISQLIKKHELTHLFLTTAFFHVLAEDKSSCFAGAQNLIVGGEALRKGPARKFLEDHPCVSLSNTYGPTENSTDSTFFMVDRDFDWRRRTIPIGRPIANSSAWVLDEKDRPCPVGIPGEICLGGDGLATGYLNRADLDALKFFCTASPLPPGRLYRSGDRGRWLADGTLEYLGRIDTQLKYRGFRIEPGEIEDVLEDVPDIREAVVVLVERKGCQSFLGAVFLADRKLESTSLKSILQSRLPAYMVPERILQLEKLPLNISGKVDLRRIRQDLLVTYPERKQTIRKALPAKMESLADVWRSVLGNEPFCQDSHFFELGGNSLLAIRLLGRIERTFGIRLTFGDLVEAPTLEQLYAKIFTRTKHSPGGSSLVCFRDSGDGVPLIGTYGHGHHASPLAWRALSEHMAENWPIYGLQGGAIDGSRIDHRTLAELAASHLPDMHPLVRERGVILMGYCAGGALAFEIMSQLAIDGIHVKRLILVDSHTPLAHAQYRESRRNTRLKRHWESIRQSGWSAYRNEVFDHLRFRLAALRTASQRRRMIQATQKKSSVPEEWRHAYMTARLSELFLNWSPKRISGQVDFIVTSSLEGVDPDYGWGRYVDGVVRVHTVDLPHLMLQDAHVAQFASKLEEILLSNGT